MLIERLVPMLAEKGYSVSIISNDVISKEDADRMRANLATNRGLLPENLVIGLATGGCPHTAIREDPSMNLSVIEEMESKLQLHLAPFLQIILFTLLMLLVETSIQERED
jgi:urease accessory protein